MWVGWIAPRALAKQWHKIIVLFSVAPLDSLREIMWLLYKWWVTVNSGEISQGIAWHHKLRKDRVGSCFHGIRALQSIFLIFCRCFLCELGNYFTKVPCIFLPLNFFIVTLKLWEVNTLLNSYFMDIITKQQIERLGIYIGKPFRILSHCMLFAYW